FARAFLLLLPYGRQLLATIGVRDRAGGGEEAPGRFVAAVEVAGAALANWGGAQARRGAGVVEDIAAAGDVLGEAQEGCRVAGLGGAGCRGSGRGSRTGERGRCAGSTRCGSR